MAKDAVKPIYVFKGGDAYLLDAARRQVISAVIGEADPQVCVSQYDSEAELTAVLDELRTLPFLAKRRMVIISPADEFVSRCREGLEKYLESPSARSSLVLVVSSWDGKTRLAKAVARVGETIDCSPPARGGLGRWIADAAKRRGKRIDRPAAELLAEYVGPDYAALDSEVEKLSLYASSREAIGLEDVSAVVAAAAGPEAFELTNAITAGDAAGALRALGGMLTARGEEFRALGMITWHLRRALESARKLSAGASQQTALPNMPAGAKSAFLEMLKHRTVDALEKDFRRLLRADLAMKTGADPVSTLQELVVHLCQPSAVTR